MGIVMRGQDDRAEGMFSYIRLEERVPADHPLRASVPWRMRFWRG